MSGKLGRVIGVTTGSVGEGKSGESLVHVQPVLTPGADSSPQDVHEALGISDGALVVIEDDDIRMSVGLYEFFMAHKAADAMRVYLHLFYTARRQQNKSVWANTKYISKGSKMGQGRVKTAKAWLAEKGIIEYRQDPSEVGRGKGKVYILLRTRLSGGTGIRLPDNQASREPTDEVLREKEKSKERNEYGAGAPQRVSPYSPTFEAFWNTYPRKKEKKKAYRVYQATLKKDVSAVELQNAAMNYAKAVAGTEERYVKHAATFLGPDEPWREWLGGPDKKAPTLKHCEKGHPYFGAECDRCAWEAEHASA